MRNFLMPALMLTATLSLAGCSGNTPPPATTNTPPVANFTVTPTNLAVSTANTSSDADAGETTTLTYEWSWGDGSPVSTGATPSHTYTTAGTFTVTLKTTDIKGDSNSKTATVTVSNPAPVAPTVLSVSPANGSVGNVAGAPIVVTFSKPMDAFVTSGAYIFPAVAFTTPLATTGSSFAWTAGNTVLTITPTTATTYATTLGTAAGTPNKYSFSITTAAKSDASAGGLALGSQLDITFSTSVQHTVALPSNPAEDATVTDFEGLSPTVALGSGLTLGIGDTSGDKGIAAYLTFSLSTLPATLLPANIVSAKLDVVNSGSTAPYTALNIGANILQVRSLVYGAPTPSTVKNSSTLVASDLNGGLIMFANTTSAVKADWAARVAQGSRSQYQLRFANATNTDATADLATIGSASNLGNEPKLTVDYLANN